MKLLTAIPVYNEERYLSAVLQEVRRYSENILIVNDGSTDGTAQLLAQHPEVHVVTHETNRGYGAALASAFAYAFKVDCEVLVTTDCDGQHEPARIAVLLEAIHDADIVSGSRYLRDFRQDTLPTPTDRRYINQTITKELNDLFGLNITDAFCGFKAYRREALAKLHITETGWGMPLQLWVQAAQAGLRIKEIGVPRIYLDPQRAFGGVLNDATERLAYYRHNHSRSDGGVEADRRQCANGRANFSPRRGVVGEPASPARPPGARPNPRGPAASRGRAASCPQPPWLCLRFQLSLRRPISLNETQVLARIGMTRTSSPPPRSISRKRANRSRMRRATLGWSRGISRSFFIRACGSRTSPCGNSQIGMPPCR